MLERPQRAANEEKPTYLCIFYVACECVRQRVIAGCFYAAFVLTIEGLTTAAVDLIAQV